MKVENMHVYAIYNRKNNKIYIGQSDNMIERLKLHSNKTFKGSYTSRFDGSWELIYSEIVDSRQKALVREKQLKSYQGRMFLRSLIKK